jgi:integrase/recombinase XerC
VNLQEAIENYLRVDRAESTRKTYRKVLGRFAGYIGPARPLTRIEPEDLDEWIYDLRQVKTKYADHPSRPAEHARLSAATVYKRVSTVKSFFNWCVKRNYIEQSPTRLVSVPNRDSNLAGKAITEADLGDVLGAARYKPRDWAILLLIVQSACRGGEAAQLRLSDLDLDNKRAYVRETKNNEPRYIYFEEEAVEAIRAYLECRPEVDHDFVFASIRGTPMTAASISQMIRRRCEDAGLDPTYGSHSLRHRAALTLFKSGEDPRVIQRYLGHKDMAVTRKYGQEIHDRELHRAAERLKVIRLNNTSQKQLRWGT